MMSVNTDLAAEIRAGSYEDRAWMMSALDRAADALEAAEAERDSAWADGYNKAISQRLAASGSIGGNF